MKTFILQASSQRTLKEFKADVGEIVASPFNKVLFDPPSTLYASAPYNQDSIRFWKLDPQMTVSQFFSYIKEECNKSRSYDYRIEFKGKFLFKPEDTKLEEMEVADEDIVVLEAKDHGKGWNFTGEGAPTVEKCEYCNKYEVLPFQCACKKV